MDKNYYTTPLLQNLSLHIELGFACSIETPVVKEELDW